MKRIAFVLLALAMGLCCACSDGGAQRRESTATASELVEKATENLLWDNVIYTNDEGAGNTPLAEIYFTHYYGAEDALAFYNTVSSYCIAVQTQNSANEIGVFKINTSFDAEAFRAERSDLTGDALTRAEQTQKESQTEKRIEAAQQYAQHRINIFLNQNESYDQKEYAKAQNALVASHGYFVYYIISGDNAGIEKIIQAQIDATTLRSEA